MRRLFLISSALLVVPLAAPATAVQNTAAAAPAASDRDPATMAALGRLGTTLRAQTNAAVRVDITTEDVLMNGQKVQFGGTVDMVVSRPNKLKMQLKVGQSERHVYYDGQKLTLYAPQQNYYAVFQAPPTIKETLKVAADEYGLEIPLADMAAWGTDAELEARVISAFPIGRENIGGYVCEHHAIRGELLDWQVWIREGADAFPCKLVITNRDDPAMPQYTAVYNWLQNLTPDPAAFTFTPPEGASPIIFGPVRKTTATASTGN